MVRRYSFAWLGSVFLHGAVFAVMAYVLDRHSVGVESAVPVVNYLSDGVVNGDDSQDEPGEHQQEEQVEIVEPAESPDTPQEIQAAQVAKLATRNAVESGSRRQQASAEIKALAPSDQIQASGTAKAPQATAINLQDVLIATTGVAARKIPAVPPQWDAEPALEALSPKQAQMLDKKLIELSEKFSQLADADATMDWQYKGQTYTATIQPQPAMTDTDIDTVSIQISTTEDGRTLSTEMKMRRLAFSNYAQFVNRWDPYVQVHDDELDGRFHANTEISIGSSRKSSPKFFGKVTTASRTVNVVPNGRRLKRKSVFLGGLETGVKRINLPKRYLPFSSPVHVDEDQIHHIERDARVVFDRDGAFRWQYLDDPGSEHNSRLSSKTTYIMADKKVKLYLRGEIHGKVLVYSPERIVIEGDLVYSTEPEQSNDYLGLVCDKNIEIAHPDVTGPGDLTVHGSIYAKRRFLVKRYRRNEGATLHIFGSLAAGSISATEPRYATRIKYDPRLERQRAPGFPMTDRYEVTDWNRSWQVH